MSLLGKKFPGAVGMYFSEFSDPENAPWAWNIRTNKLTYLFTYSQAFDSLLRRRPHCPLRRQLSPERSVQHC
ncbi:unnamed protein product [Penicillium olsonii]|nr:unnamed protein product [Penicillium olsonii]CAG7925941.1 unnamed protein product [Penicillium olsonii]